MLVRRLGKPGGLVSLSDSHQLRSGYVQLEPGKEVGEHKTEGGEEILVVMGGTATILCGGETETVRSPAEVLIPAHTVHNVKNKSGDILKYVYVVAVNRS